MPRTPRPIGDNLVALTNELPHVAMHEIWPEDGRHPAEAAVATPFLRRMRAVLALIDSGPVTVDRACHALREAAPMTHLQHGSPEERELGLLRAALRHDLLDYDAIEGGLPALSARTALLRRGRQAHRVAGHPLAAVVEPWIDEMLGDPVGGLDCDPRLPWAAVPFLIVQLLARVGEVDLDDVAEALRREAGPLTRDARRRSTLHHTVVGLVMSVSTEHGVVEWDGDMQQLRRGRITPLGLIAEGGAACRGRRRAATGLRGRVERDRAAGVVLELMGAVPTATRRRRAAAAAGAAAQAPRRRRPRSRVVDGRHGTR